MQTAGEAFTVFKQAGKIILRGPSNFRGVVAEGTRSLLETIFR